MSDKTALPFGWLELQLEGMFLKPGDDIVDGPFGSNLKASEYVPTGVPIARLQNIDRNRFVSKNIQYVTKQKAEQLARHTFTPGDILITKLGDPLGKACLAPSTIEKGVLVADVVRARLTHHWIDRRFLCYQINADNVVEQFKEQTKGTTRPRVNLTKIRTLDVRLCPLSEQTRIVEKIEELLSDLDAGVAELKAAQKKLGQYRQSLLKAAVEGALTAEWRSARKVGAGDTAPETGAQLLERILTERRARWEAKQLSKFAEQGKASPKDWRQKYPEPIQPDTSDLPELPDGWVWASAEQLFDFITKGTTPPKEMDSGSDKTIPFLRVTNLTDRGELDLVDKVFVSDKTHKGFLARSVVYPNDVLMNIVGPPLGQVAVVPSTFAEWNINQAIAIFRAVEGVLPSFVCLYLLSPSAQQWLKARSKTTAGQTNLTLEVCRSLPFPLPPEEEQQALLLSLDGAMDATARQSDAIKSSLKQSTAQRKNILKAAFSGQLVPQDPNDEPASVLLERIRAERAKRDAVKKPRGRKSRELA